ncbi:MAG: HDOD domain-containing protein [Desulfobacterales bacterium]|nr:HDOD domain-containing protein [Desulfobacterales bacterium]
MAQENKDMMQKIIETSKALPPMPQVIARATEVLSDERAGFMEIAQVLESDQGMATRVLKLANSAYYGVKVPVKSVQQASALLGFKTLFEMIVVVNSSKMMGKRLEGYEISARQAWEHSLFTAYGARAIAEEKFPELVDDAFMAGLLHDAGMLILDPYLVKEKKSFDRYLENGKTIEQAETEVFGFNHSQLAAKYLKKWMLPASQTHAIEFHHRPSQSEGDVLSCILHAADALANGKGPEKNFVMEEGALQAIETEPDEMEQLALELESSVANLIENIDSETRI